MNQSGKLPAAEKCSSMIVTENLTKNFDDFTAVKNVTLSVEKGEVLALLGPNGAGKTTTIRMLTSILRPSAGTAQVAGYDVVTDAAHVRQVVGVLTEMHGLYGRMYAGEYLEFFGRLYGMDGVTRAARIKLLLERFDLTTNRKKRIGQYSKGMNQKLALARALLHDPAVLLLDEPTSAMDPESARLVRDSIHELRSSERTIVICTHNLAEAEELADKIAIIRKGRIIAVGKPSQLKEKLLGPAEYEVSLAHSLNGRKPQLPDNIQVTLTEPDRLRYIAEFPAETNPMVLKTMLDQGFLVMGLREVSRSLEQVYLQAVNSDREPEELS